MIAAALQRSFDESSGESGEFRIPGLSDRKLRVVARTPSTTAALSQLPGPTWLDSVILRAIDLCLLPENWDGYGGVAVDITTMQYAFILLKSVVTSSTPKCSVVPLAAGGLQFEWHTKAADLEVAVYGPYEVEVTFSDKSGVSEEFPLDADVTPLKERLKTLA